MKKTPLQEKEEENMLPIIEMLDFEENPNNLNFEVYLTKMTPQEMRFSMDFENYEKVSTNS